MSYADEDANEIVHVNPDGEIVYRDQPEGMDLKRKFDSYISPWGDLWLSYNEYDAIGADQGQKTLLIRHDGSQAPQETFIPHVYRESDTNQQKTFFLRDKDEIFHIEKERLLKLDEAYNILEEYAYSTELEELINPWTFVGYDGNLYIWDPYDTKSGVSNILCKPLISS